MLLNFARFLGKEDCMYTLLVRLMVVAALLELNRAGAVLSADKRYYFLSFERMARAVLHVEWRPISVFHGEARRFKCAMEHDHDFLFCTRLCDTVIKIDHLLIIPVHEVGHDKIYTPLFELLQRRLKLTIQC